MRREPIQGTHQVEVLDSQRRLVRIELQLRYSQMTVHPAIGKQKEYPSLPLIHAWERGKPTGRQLIRWKLLTDLPVENVESAIEKVDWYSQRWKIETFDKVLLSTRQQMGHRNLGQNPGFHAHSRLLAWPI
jgi:hypothetical protein